jgi:hypothetical protein
MGSLLFMTDKFRDLKLQELELQEDMRSGTDCLPPGLVRVDLVSEAQHGHTLGLLGERDPNPSKDKADHTTADHEATTDLIHRLSPKSNSEGDRGVYMVAQGDQPPDKTIKEIQREAKEEIAWAARLARGANKRKGHNSM